MSQTTQQNRGRIRPRRRSGVSTTMAFLLGVPLGFGLLAAVHQTPLLETWLGRYLSHPVEMVTLMLFACATGALLSKFVGYLNELSAFQAELLPDWEGEPRSVDQASVFLEEVRQREWRLKNTFLGRRILSVLDFVESRKSANDLDDHLRGLADNDDIALENSYGLVRFITWAIPILGFLGTVLGITGAISGVTPEVLENDLSRGTDCLGTAFYTTAVSLALTMVTMFMSFVMERLEQGALEKVNDYADEQLAHRFERTGADSGEFVQALRKNTDILLQSTEQLIQRQVNLWSLSMQEAQRHWQETGNMQQAKITAGLEGALEKSLETHSQRLAQQEQTSRQASAEVGDQLQKLTEALDQSIGRQQTQMAKILEQVSAQAKTLSQLVESGAQLVQLQEVLHQNLQTLAGAGAFEQAVNSLTAAIHLLTTKTGNSTGNLPRGPRNPGAAA